MLPTLSLYAVVASLLWHRYKDFKGEFALFFEKNAQKWQWEVKNYKNYKNPMNDP